MSIQKSQKAFRTITEAAAILDLPAHVLRFWESKFRQIKPMKRGGGRRYYRPEDIQLLIGIKELLYSKGLTIKGAQRVIQSNGTKSIIKLGAEKISDQHKSKTYTTSERKAPSELDSVSLGTFDLSNAKIHGDADRKKLVELLKDLQLIQSRIKNRCEKR